MKIVKRGSGYSTETVVALLEGGEKELHNHILVMMADGRPRATAEKIYADKGHPGHFGYRDLRFAPGKRDKKRTYMRVTIQTD